MEKLEFKTYDNMFGFYEYFKSDDEYFLDIDNKKVTIHQGFFPNQKNGIHSVDVLDEEKNIVRIVVQDEMVERFHPNNINNQRFWKLAKTKFPLVSVNGGHSVDVQSCNDGTFEFAKKVGIINVLNKVIENSPEKLNLFEIGYGHGNLYERYKDKVNYLGIDYYKIDVLKKEDRLLVIKKSGIPRKIINNSQDIIYSFNVLQHCSQQDRFKYFRQSYSKLKIGGVFLGGAFMVTEKNKNDFCWGVEDKNGRRYTKFFNQLTEVDTYEEFYNEVNDIGFKVVAMRFINNYSVFVLQK